MTVAGVEQERIDRTAETASRLRPLIGLAVLLLALHFPFYDQPFHMDGAVYLKIARQVFLNPYFPQDFPLLFEGVRAKDAASMEHPPFVPYFLAASARITGSFSERALHLAYLVFPLIAVLSTYWLGQRFTSHPGTTAFLLITCPAFYVLSHNRVLQILSWAAIASRSRR